MKPIAVAFVIASLALLAFSWTLRRAYAVGLTGSSTVVRDLVFLVGSVFACWVFALVFMVVLRKRRTRA
jgi:hypothetical protein